MSLTLAIEDSADGTGAAATVAGGESGQTYSVYYQAKYLANGTWTFASSRVGNGTLSLSIAPGYYWGYASGTVSAAPTLSNISAFCVTASDQSMQEKVQDAVQAEIQSMCGVSLTGLNAAQIYVQMSPDDKAALFPCVFLTPQSAEQFQVATNLRDDVGHPVVVMIADRNSEDYVTNMPTYLLWRERIIRKFMSQRLSGVAESMICSVEPAPIFDPKLPAYEKMVSAFTLRFKCREPRGNASDSSNTFLIEDGGALLLE